MSTHLYIAINHTLQWKAKKYKAIVAEIEQRLTTIQWNNAFWEDYTKWQNKHNYNKWRIGHNYPYIIDEPLPNTKKQDFIRVNLSNNIRVTFAPNAIIVYPCIRFNDWWEMWVNGKTLEKIIINEHRKFYETLAIAFNGNKAFYAADNCHYLDNFFTENATITYEDELKKIALKLGTPVTNVEKMLSPEQNAYFIDDFTTINNTLTYTNQLKYPTTEDWKKLKDKKNQNPDKLKFIIEENDEAEHELMIRQTKNSKYEYYLITATSTLFTEHWGKCNSFYKKSKSYPINQHRVLQMLYLIEKAKQKGFKLINYFTPINVFVPFKTTGIPNEQKLNTLLLYFGIGLKYKHIKPVYLKGKYTGDEYLFHVISKEVFEQVLNDYMQLGFLTKKITWRLTQ